MGAPIFPNCSYLLALGASAEFIRRLEVSSIQNRSRSFLCKSFAEFKNVKEVTESIIGIIVQIDDFDALERTEILDFLNKEFPKTGLVSVLILTAHEKNRVPEIPKSDLVQVMEPKRDISWEKVIDKFFADMTPVGLDRMLLHALNSVLPTFFNGVGSFILGKQAIDGWDYQLNYSMSAGDIVGMCSVRVKWQKILALVPNDQKDKAWDILKESFNQSLGVIIQNIVKLGIDMKLGLPTVFDLARVPYVQTMKFYPSVHAVDSTDSFACSMGFYDLAHKALFDLSTANPGSNSEEIEFL